MLYAVLISIYLQYLGAAFCAGSARGRSAGGPGAYGAKGALRSASGGMRSPETASITAAEKFPSADPSRARRKSNCQSFAASYRGRALSSPRRVGACSSPRRVRERPEHRRPRRLREEEPGPLPAPHMPKPRSHFSQAGNETRLPVPRALGATVQKSKPEIILMHLGAVRKNPRRFGAPVFIRREAQGPSAVFASAQKSGCFSRVASA